MSSDSGLLRGVSWREFCPWLLILRTLRLATSTHLIVLALAGAVATPAGWWVVGKLLAPSQGNTEEPTASGQAPVPDPDMAVIERLSRWPGSYGTDTGLSPATRLLGVSHAPIDPVIGVPYRMVEPFRRLFDPRISWAKLFYFLLGGFWSLAVWAFFGGAITRVAVVRLGLDERVGLRDSVAFAQKKWTALFAAPALPMLGIAMIALPMAVLGLLMRLNAGVLLAGILWPLVLVGGFLMAILALGLLFSWPLMWGAIATENSDAFDAISRAYAYSFQRALHYLGYAFLAAVLGLLSWSLAWGFSEMVVALSYWGASWGTGGTRLLAIQAAVAPPTPTPEATEVSTALWLGANLIGLFVGLVRAIASAFAFSYFWCAAAAIYLLLRRDTDQTEFDDVVVDDEDDVVYGLPPLENDGANVPGVSPAEQGNGARATEEPQTSTTDHPESDA
jgi:hypothetical protein